jgi:hypothetical protein
LDIPDYLIPRPDVTIDWNLVVQVAVPIATLFLGAWVTQWFEKQPSLTTYFGHVSAFQHTLDDGTKAAIYTHSVVIHNAGKKTANNVRLRHNTLPGFQIYPSVDYKVVDLPDGAKEIVVPTLVPKEQITVSYLYFPPLTYAQVNAGIKSDEGLAREIPVLLQRQYPQWFNLSALLVLFVGLIAILYLGVLGIRHLAR